MSEITIAEAVEAAKEAWRVAEAEAEAAAAWREAFYSMRTAFAASVARAAAVDATTAAERGAA